MKKLYNLSIKIYTQKELLRHCILYYSQRQTATCKTFTQMFPHTTEASNHPGNNFQHARKYQTFCGMICGRPASIKPFGKRLSPGAETLNPSGNDFCNARKSQTIRETTFAKRGNHKLRPLQNSSYNLSFLNIFVPLWYETEVILSKFC